MSQGAKAAKAVGKSRKTLEKVTHGFLLKTNIPAGMASTTPPLGSMLGQRGIAIANFVKDYNEQTKNIKDGTPMQARIQVQGDRSYILEILKPSLSYLVKQAAGIRRASMEAKVSCAGVISLKHVYEIAKFKNDEINCAHFSLEQMCHNVIRAANSCGIRVVREDLDPEELREFLNKRKEIELAELNDIAEKKKAKLMRASAAAAAASTAAQAAKK